jgi:uncharacterized damage-inducible protein DinB
MELLLDAFRHNAWANSCIFQAVQRLTPEQLAEPVPGIYGSVIVTAHHLVHAEDRYLALIMGDDWRPLPEMGIDQLAAALSERDGQFVKYVDRVSGEALAAHSRCHRYNGMCAWVMDCYRS